MPRRKITLTISKARVQRSAYQLKKHVAVSQRFLTLAALRAEFVAWSKAWGGNFRMRPVRVEGGGYAGVLLPKKRLRFPIITSDCDCGSASGHRYFGGGG